MPLKFLAGFVPQWFTAGLLRTGIPTRPRPLAILAHN